MPLTYEERKALGIIGLLVLIVGTALGLFVAAWMEKYEEAWCAARSKRTVEEYMLRNK